MKKRYSSILLVVLCAFIFSACATQYDSRGMYHKVRKGETLLSIAEYYNTKPEDIARLNYIDVDTALTKGQKIYLGGAKHPSEKVAKGKKSKKYGYKGTKGQFDKPLALEDVQLSWPADGTVYSSYGIRHGRRHDGMDIAAKSGSPIKAAADGLVVFNGYMRGYGNILILQHGKRVFTTYAHNQDNLVNEGDVVKKGDMIAYIGTTGRTSGPHVHFEVRYGSDAKNPIFYLPLETDEHRALYAAAKESSSSGRAVASRTLGGSKSSKKAYANHMRDKKSKTKLKANSKDQKQVAKKSTKTDKNSKSAVKKQSVASKSGNSKSVTSKSGAEKQVATNTATERSSVQQKAAPVAAEKKVAAQPAKKKQTVAKKGTPAKKAPVSNKVAAKPAQKKPAATASAPAAQKKPGDMATRKAPAPKN